MFSNSIFMTSQIEKEYIELADIPKGSSSPITTVLENAYHLLV
jgi:hypothetical protein